VDLVIVIASVAAAAFAAWGVWLQIDSRRPLLTVRFGGSQNSSINGRPMVDYILYVHYDGNVSVRQVSVVGVLDGVETTTPMEYLEPVNLAPDAQAVFIARLDQPKDGGDPLDGRTLTARIDYNGRTKNVPWIATTTLR
jgi:hypothetical protein